jgi:SAM-dependent methyltransferase
MSPWKSFYAGREGHDYLQYAKKRYAPFINAINSRIRRQDLVMEIGCGTGTITKALVGPDVVVGRVEYCASDIDPEMVGVAKSRLAQDNVTVFQRSAIDPLSARADVVHSHGMLEHFNDETIREVIRVHKSARVQVHYVPGLYDEPTFGDERLMSVQAWWDICQPSQIITFNGGLDYALVFER